MKSMLLFFVVISAMAQSFSQDDTEKRLQKEAAAARDTTIKLGWHYSSIAGLNLSQVALSNWTSGGESSLAYGLSMVGSAVNEGEKTRWFNNLKATFGQARVGDQELRKTDDELYFESYLIYLIGTTINPYGSFTLRTQFAPGYNYASDGTKTQISALFDPAYLTQSVGMAYTPTSILTTRLGVGVREVLTSTYNGFADDPKTPEIEKTRIQGGIESVTDLKWGFAENMLFTSRLELFAPFKELDRVIVRNDNTIAAKVNQYITVNLNVQLINDVNITPRTQVKEALSIGLTYALF